MHLGIILWFQGPKLVRGPIVLPPTHTKPLLLMFRYERIAWIPVVITFVVALGVGGKHLINPPPAEPASASVILSFAATIAGFAITYSPLSSDFTNYFHPSVPTYVSSESSSSHIHI